MRSVSPRPTPSTPASYGDQNPRSERSGAISGHFTSDEKRKIFRGMVVGELEAGFLRYSRRQSLIQYATRLGISEFDANLLIAEAQFHRDQIEPTGFMTPATLDVLARPERWSVSLRISLALVIAAFVDLLLIHFLVR